MSLKNSDSTGNLEPALEYIKRGLKIFPLFYVLRNGTCSCHNPRCKRIGKHPLIKNGVLSASSDEAQVLQWWTEHKYANIGLACGHGGLIGKWSRLSRPFFARNKLRIGGSDLSGAAEAAPAIPALESALGFHSWRALSSAQVH